jgi:hypothetical protein
MEMQQFQLLEALHLLYSWNTNPIQTSATATGLAAATYTVTVTDANGCVDSSPVTITEPVGMSATISAQTCIMFQTAAVQQMYLPTEEQHLMAILGIQYQFKHQHSNKSCNWYLYGHHYRCQWLYYNDTSHNYGTKRYSNFNSSQTK